MGRAEPECCVAATALICAGTMPAAGDGRSRGIHRDPAMLAAAMMEFQAA
jgi:hypothetical protein